MAVVGCASHQLTLPQAKQLALAAPNIEASVRLNHAAPKFEYIKPLPRGWYFDITAANPCPRVRPCSKLLGHYDVGKFTGDVTNLDEGMDGVSVTSRKIVALRRQFLGRDCHHTAAKPDHAP